MPYHPIRLPKASSGFSLMELLVVIGLILILSVLALPAVRGITGGTGVTAAAEEFAAAVNLARQRATTFNRQTAIRLWQDGTHYKSYQIWEQEDSSNPSSWRAAERERRLPANTVVIAHPTFSSLLTRAGTGGTTNGRSYAEFLFTPSGSVVIEPTNTAITFINERGPNAGGIVSGLPPNFATVTVDPFNGIPRVYRP